VGERVRRTASMGEPLSHSEAREGLHKSGWSLWSGSIEMYAAHWLSAPSARSHSRCSISACAPRAARREVLFQWLNKALAWRGPARPPALELGFWLKGLPSARFAFDTADGRLSCLLSARSAEASRRLSAVRSAVSSFTNSCGG